MVNSRAISSFRYCVLTICSKAAEQEEGQIDCNLRVYSSCTRACELARRSSSESPYSIFKAVHSLHAGKKNVPCSGGATVFFCACHVNRPSHFLTPKRHKDPCDPIYNPEGYIALCVAENKLVLDIISERFFQAGTATAAFSNPDCYCYNSMSGMPVARKAVAYFLARRFLYPDELDLAPEKALKSILPEQVCLSTGAAPLLNHLFFLLGEAGDGCLIPAPYYAAFENDMNVVAGIVPCSLEQANPVAGPTEQEMEQAYQKARQVCVCVVSNCETKTVRSLSFLIVCVAAFREVTRQSSF